MRNFIDIIIVNVLNLDYDPMYISNKQLL